MRGDHEHSILKNVKELFDLKYDLGKILSVNRILGGDENDSFCVITNYNSAEKNGF